MSKAPEIGEGKRGEDGYLGYLLRQAAGAYRNSVERMLGDLGITLPQFSILTMLDAYPGLSNAEVARLSLLTPQTANVIIANLLKGELVARRPHATHGRIQQIALTERGRTLLLEAKKQVQPIESELVHHLNPEQELVVRRWLVRMAAELGGE